MARRANHTGSIRPHHSGGFRIRLSVEGQKVDKVLRINEETGKPFTEDEAREWAKAKGDELADRHDKGLPGPMAFSKLLARFEDKKIRRLAPNTQRTYKNSLKAFRSYFVEKGRNPMASEIRSGHVEGFLEWRETHRPGGERVKDPLSARALNKDRATLHRVFTYGMQLEVVNRNPVAVTEKVDGDAREPLILTAEQYESLLDVCEDRPMLRMYLLLLGESGVRCESEALWIRWQDVDYENNELFIETVRKGLRTKSGKSRRVPMTRRLREALKDHEARFRMALYHGKRSQWVFHHETDRGRGTAGQRVKSMRDAFHRAREQAELPADLHMHDLRHMRVVTWLDEGHPIHLVKDAMGHSSVTVTEGYDHLVSKRTQRLVEEPDRRKMQKLVSR